MNATPSSTLSTGTAPPSGTITFAFTDIEGSTQRWERNRAAMENAVRRHDAIVRRAIARHGGYIFKTLGDAFYAAFARPQDAVAAILDAQRALALEDFSAVDGLNVRAAIHTGTADERDGDYFGPAVNRVARLLAIGHGGQVLVSGVTTDLVHGALPPQATLRDLGEHRLKDLARPEYVYQLLAPDLPADFPPLRSLDSLPNNLPRLLKSFIGREKEIADLTELLSKNPLVTLVGSGGVGKTRTSLQVAANLLDGSGDGVWFVELAPLAEGAYIPATVAQALGIRLPAGDPLDHLIRVLKTKRMLLVFDNCEHLVEPAAVVIAAILRACPSVKILASSRQGLGLEGEVTYRLPSLSLPSGNEPAMLSATDSTRYAAIALFVERARAVDNRFDLSDENVPIIADICRRLDGIPLAIELAASRVKILSPRQLRDRLDERFRVLTGGSRDVLPRQQTLRALIDWSHDLLDDRERALFRRLGIFVNGFTLEGAAAVGTGNELDEFDVFDVLAALVDKSLVLTEVDGDALRYRLLESTRVYAAEKLAASGKREACARRRLFFLRDAFSRAQDKYEQDEDEEPMHALFGSELEDVRAALDDALILGEVAAGADLFNSIIAMAWGGLGLGPEGIRRGEAILEALPETNARAYALLADTLAEFYRRATRVARALDFAETALAKARTAGDESMLARVLARYIHILLRLGRHKDAETPLAEAEALVGVPPPLRRRLLVMRALYHTVRGEIGSAVLIQEQLRGEYRALGILMGLHMATVHEAEAQHQQGNTQRAIELTTEILPHARTMRERQIASIPICNLAAYHTAVGDLDRAAAFAKEAIALLAAREPGHMQIANAIEHLALVAALRGDVGKAAVLEGYAEGAYERLRGNRENTETIAHNRLIGILEDSLSTGELTSLTAKGAALEPAAAIALSLEETPA